VFSSFILLSAGGIGEVKDMQNILKKHKILVVEDDIHIQQVLYFFLRQSGFESLGVLNGQEAIEVIPQYCPDLIILDLMMYPVSGWEVLHWLRAHNLTPRLPIIVVTARVHLPDQLHGFEEGAVEYLTKPTQPGVIIERVQTLLSLGVEQRLLLQRKRIDEQRLMLERINAVQFDKLAW
jgi:DNA-binding response OmpR family regulator